MLGVKCCRFFRGIYRYPSSTPLPRLCEVRLRLFLHFHHDDVGFAVIGEEHWAKHTALRDTCVRNWRCDVKLLILTFCGPWVKVHYS